MFKFGLSNLNSTEDASSKNCSEVSDILGPFNSTLSEKDDLDSSNESDEFKHKVPLVDQYEYINWKPKARHANKLYLRNFNRSVDLGINLAVAQQANEDSEDEQEEISSPDQLGSRQQKNLLQRTVTQYEPNQFGTQKFKEPMPAIPEHFGDELSPRGLEKERNLEPLYEIGN